MEEIKEVSTELVLPKISIDLINELNKKGIRYCHWKSNEHLIPGLQGKTDLDLLVHKEDYSTFIKIMGDLKIKRIQQTNHKIPEIEDWLGFCTKSGVLIHLHVHFSLITGKKNVKEITFPWADLCLSSSYRDVDTNMQLINPNIEFILLMLRIALKVTLKAKILSFIKRDNPYSKDIQDEFNYLKGKIDEKELDYYLKQVFSNKVGLKSQIKKMYYKDHINRTDLNRLKKSYQREYFYTKKYNGLVTNYRYFIGIKKRYQDKLFEVMGFNKDRRKKFDSGGILVAIIGSDGAGKSTMIEQVNRWLRWKLNVYNIYLGSGDSTKNNGLKFINLLMRKRKKNKVSSLGHNNTKKKKHESSFKLFLKKKYFMYIAREKLRNVYKAQKLKINGNIVITDRYPQNQFLGTNDSPGIKVHVSKQNNVGYSIKAQTKEERLYDKMLEIEPDIVIKLIVSPEEAIRRKPDHDYNQVKEKGKILELLTYNNSKIYKVDANKPVDEVELEIRRILWENL